MEEDDIAAAMGFSSFGGTKKRKYDQTNSPKTKADASGANTTKLGVKTKIVASSEQENIEDAEFISAAGPMYQIAQPQSYNNTQKSPAATGLASFLARGQALPGIPPEMQYVNEALSSVGPSATETVSFGGPSISRDQLNALRFGVKNENGDTAYFLPSFVEDPWKSFMKGGK